MSYLIITFITIIVICAIIIFIYSAKLDKLKDENLSLVNEINSIIAQNAMYKNILRTKGEADEKIQKQTSNINSVDDAINILRNNKN